MRRSHGEDLPKYLCHRLRGQEARRFEGSVEEVVDVSIPMPADDDCVSVLILLCVLSRAIRSRQVIGDFYYVRHADPGLSPDVPPAFHMEPN